VANVIAKDKHLFKKQLTVVSEYTSRPPAVNHKLGTILGAFEGIHETSRPCSCLTENIPCDSIDSLILPDLTTFLYQRSRDYCIGMICVCRKPHSAMISILTSEILYFSRYCGVAFDCVRHYAACSAGSLWVSSAKILIFRRKEPEIRFDRTGWLIG
jgi:hypothetical protein